jgi:hypothetical protein
MAVERYEALREEVLGFHWARSLGPDSATYTHVYLRNRAVPGSDIEIIGKDMARGKIAFVTHW